MSAAVSWSDGAIGSCVSIPSAPQPGVYLLSYLSGSVKSFRLDLETSTASLLQHSSVRSKPMAAHTQRAGKQMSLLDGMVRKCIARTRLQRNTENCGHFCYQFSNVSRPKYSGINVLEMNANLKFAVKLWGNDTHSLKLHSISSPLSCHP